jgi:predicted ester cyclase
MVTRRCASDRRKGGAHMKFSSHLLAALLANALLCSAGAQEANGADPGEKLYRENAPKFHQNFSAGAFEKNGPLVTPDIDVDSNNVKLTGRDNFVARIKRYSVPFPGLQLKDRVIIVDGNTAAVNYYLQGRHGGPYGKIAATGNNVQAMSGEVFEFTPEGLMKKLTTITDIHLLEAQINGSVKVAEFQKVLLLPNGSVSAERRAKVRATAALFDKNFNERHLDANANLAAKDVRIDADNGVRHGRSELLKLRQRLAVAFPDMNIQDEYVLADGNRAAVEYIMQGTQTGPYTRPDGTQLAPTGRPVHVRGIDFMEFDRAGLLRELVVVHNESDFESQLAP